MKLSIRYEGRPRPWARPQVYRRKGGGFARVENKASHWSRTAFDEMKRLWNVAWLSSAERKSWDPEAPMILTLAAHFHGREGGHLEASLEPIDPFLARARYPHAPDADNVIKLCMEAAQKAGVVKNDCQIVVVMAEKWKPYTPEEL